MRSLSVFFCHFSCIRLKIFPRPTQKGRAPGQRIAGDRKKEQNGLCSWLRGQEQGGRGEYFSCLFSLICAPPPTILLSAHMKRKRSCLTKSRRGKRRAWMMQLSTMTRISVVGGGREGEICICFVLILLRNFF